jgi:hypothetical protein
LDFELLWLAEDLSSYILMSKSQTVWQANVGQTNVLPELFDFIRVPPIRVPFWLSYFEL